MSITIKSNTISTEQNSMFGNISKTEKNIKSGKSIFAGDLNLEENPIEKKRKEAQQKAFKVVSDTWDNEKKIDDSIQARRDLYSEQLKRQAEASEQLNNVNNNMDVLKEQYDISDDSQEQKDLLIYEKVYDSMNGIEHESLTDEENARYKELMKNSQPQTQYQKDSLEMYAQAKQWENQITDAKLQMNDAVRDISSINLERLKSHPMVDAQKQSDIIMDAANKEIVGMLMEEAKDYIDEKAQEAQDNADKKAEEDKEQEEQQQKVEEERAIQEALVERTKEAIDKAEAVKRENASDDYQLDDVMSETVQSLGTSSVQKSLDDIKNSMALLEADLKGIKVDEEV